MSRRWLLGSLALLTVVATGVFMTSRASANIFLVTTLTDNVPGSLRDAINQANGNGTGQDTIVFNVTGTITFAVPTELSILSDLIITGPGASLLTIQGTPAVRVFNVAPSRTVSMSGLTIQGGGAIDVNGGGIANQGDLTLTNVVVRGNLSACGFNGECGGSGISNTGTLTLTDVTVSNNNLVGNTGPGKGAGIRSVAGTVRLRNTTISDNFNLAGNSLQPPFGGGLSFENTTAFLNNVTISGNTVAVAGAVGLGGGIYTSGGDVRLRNVTIANNTAGAAGGIYQAGALVNSANSIVAGNIGGLTPDCFPGLQSNGYNLIDNPTNCTFPALMPTDITGINPNLAALANNGGPTQTHALNSGSPAIDGGNPIGCPDTNQVLMTTDQRGLPRPTDGDTNGSFICDIGAFEAPGPAAPPPTPTATATATATVTATATATVTGGGDSKVVPTLPPPPPTSIPPPTSTPFNPKLPAP